MGNRTIVDPHHPSPTASSHHESNDDRDNEGIDRDCLGQRRGENHDGADLTGGLRVATDGLHRAATDETDTDAGSDAPQPDGETRTERFCRIDFHSRFLPWPPLTAARVARGRTFRP